MNQRSNDLTNAKVKNVVKYLAQAWDVILKQYNVTQLKWTQFHLAKCLWILTKDVPSLSPSLTPSNVPSLICKLYFLQKFPRPYHSNIQFNTLNNTIE